MRQIQIGERHIKTITSEELSALLCEVGCIASLEFWTEPVITYQDYDAGMFGDTVFFDFIQCKKNSDEIRKTSGQFYISIDEQNAGIWTERAQSIDFKIKTLNWLLQKGFELPLTA